MSVRCEALAGVESVQITTRYREQRGKWIQDTLTE